MTIRVRKQRCMSGLPWWTVIRIVGSSEFTCWLGSFDEAIGVADELARGGTPKVVWMGAGVYPSPRNCVTRLLEISEVARHGVVPVGFIGGVSA